MTVEHTQGGAADLNLSDRALVIALTLPTMAGRSTAEICSAYRCISGRTVAPAIMEATLNDCVRHGLATRDHDGWKSLPEQRHRIEQRIATGWQEAQ